METRDLSKLQIRAEVLSIIQQYKTKADFKLSKQKSDIENLLSIKDQKSVIELLLKELIKASDIKKSIISIFITEIAELSDIEDTLWNLIRNTKISDEVKESIVSILKTLGGKINTEELLEHFNSPEDIIDKETKSLLETATINPEAQIDFLDFLFSLKITEQLQLIDSLKQDYLSNELANILVPALLSTPDIEVQKAIIEILGLTKSYLAVEPLINISKISQDDSLKRLAIKNLNILKLSGVNIDDKENANLRETQICQMTQFYKAYASQVDGSGGQGIIFSRILDDKIYMFSVIISDSEGIIDCFGFSGISKDEFHRIVDRFASSPTSVSEVPAEYCKTLMNKAEKVNESLGSTLSYEYLCWRSFAHDIEEADFDKFKDYQKLEITPNSLEEIYKTSDFDTWFFEYGDNQITDDLITFSLNEFDTKDNQYIKNLDEKIYDSIKKYFSEKSTEIITNRLELSGIFYGLQEKQELKNICLSLSNFIQNSSIEKLIDNTFIIDLFKRSIVQYIILSLEENAKDTVKSTTRFTSTKKESNKPVIKSEKLAKLLDFLEENWSN